MTKAKPNTSDDFRARVETMDAQTKTLAGSGTPAPVGSANPKIHPVRPERVEWLRRYNESLRIYRPL